MYLFLLTKRRILSTLKHIPPSDLMMKVSRKSPASESRAVTPGAQLSLLINQSYSTKKTHTHTHAAQETHPGLRVGSPG